MWVDSDFIKISWDGSIYSQSFGAMAQINRICKEDCFSHWSFASSHMGSKLYGAKK